MFFLKKYIHKETSIYPLVVFRIGFGVLMLCSILRFWANGWIEKLYIAPTFFFSYWGFGWVKPLGVYTYLVFIVCAIACVLVILGYKYRWGIVAFFLSFTYIELMDKTTYLNHYYFISVLSFLMIFLPANGYFSIDSRKRSFRHVPRWCVDSIKVLLGMVYVYAGVAKINADWLLEALPLKIWLSSKNDMFLLGHLFEHPWSYYAFSWIGMLYDIFIPFLLLYRKTRWLAFGLVVIFHTLTRILFPIGMFPYVMIMATLIFFSAEWHRRVIVLLRKCLMLPASATAPTMSSLPRSFGQTLGFGVVALLLVVQLLFPWRYVLYPGNLFWNEEGFRYSWRVMLMEKTGYTQFKVMDKSTGESFYVDPSKFLTRFQEKQMSTQADFILEFAHFLKRHYRTQEGLEVAVFVESWVSLNGRPKRAFINPHVDLTDFQDQLAHQSFILPFDDDKNL